MTKPKPLPEIARRACGSVADVFLGYRFYVKCLCGVSCWFGPSMKTARGAILAWNRTMTTPWLLKKIRDSICSRIEKLCYTRSGLLHDKYVHIVAELNKIRMGK